MELSALLVTSERQAQRLELGLQLGLVLQCPLVLLLLLPRGLGGAACGGPATGLAAAEWGQQAIHLDPDKLVPSQLSHLLRLAPNQLDGRRVELMLVLVLVRVRCWLWARRVAVAGRAGRAGAGAGGVQDDWPRDEQSE